MKKISLVLLIFVLSLFLIPPTSAAYGDISAASITSFAETLPDDVLYFPDFDLESNVSTTTEYIDNMESVSYWDAAAQDWDTWESTGGNLHARYDSVSANKYPLRHMDWDDNDDPDPRPEVTEYDDTTYSWYLRFKVDYNDSADYFRIGFYDTPWGGTLEWFSFLTYSKNVWHYVVYDPTTTMTDLDRIDVNAQLDNGEYAELWLDWIAVIPTANNLDPSFDYDGSSYREGFNDVSDWTTSGTSIATDGDVATITENDAGADTGRAYASFGSTDFFEYYYEFRIVSMTATTADLEFWDGASYNTLKTFTTAGTYKGIISDTDAATMQRIGFLVGSDGGNINPDYLRVAKSTEMGWQHDGSTTSGVSLAPIDYEEDGVSADNWDEIYQDDGDAYGSDGSSITLEASYDGGSNDYYTIYDTSIAFVITDDTSIRIRFRVNDTNTYRCYLYLFGNDAMDFTTYGSYEFTLSTSWTIITLTLADFWTLVLGDGSTLEGIRIQIRQKVGNSPIKFEYDYFYIGNVDQFDDGGTISSDGDELTITADADGSIFKFLIDTTVTASKLITSYYPFLGLEFNDGDSADYIMVQSHDGSSLATVIGNTTIGTDTLHANVQSVDSEVESFWLSVNPSAVVRLDWLQAYDIANFTSTLTGDGIDDYLYVSSNILYSNVDSGTIVLDHDPVLSVASASYAVYNLTTSGTAPEFSQYVSSWSTYSANTRGAVTTGTVTDIRLRFDGTEIISAIKFIDTYDWQDAGEARFIFPIGWDPTFQFGFDAFFIFLGLIMIPVSTLYLVRGRRKEASMDKLFYGLIIFAVGLGLLIGGITP